MPSRARTPLDERCDASDSPDDADDDRSGEVPIGSLTRRHEVRDTPVVRSMSSRPCRTDVPFTHPTSVPDYDLEAFARVSLPHGSPRTPLDVAIPRQAVSIAAVAHELDLRAAFIFLHVDGEASIADIASYTELSAAVVEDIILMLQTIGAIEIAPKGGRGRGHHGDPPVSGVFPGAPSEGEPKD
jgi:hypothetical protein